MEVISVDLNEEAISVEDDEETVRLTPTLMTSIEYVYLNPPPHRRDDFGHIYGHVSVTDDLSKPAVTLFSRRRDDPQVLDLANNGFCYLYFTHHGSDRPLSGNSDNYVNLRLYEKKIIEEEEEEEEEDQSCSEQEQEQEEEEILHIESHKIENFDDNTNTTVWDGKHGFQFEMRHAAIYGLRVEVEVKIINQEISSGSIYGRITAWQQLAIPRRYAGVRLYSVSEHTPAMVRVGETLPLDRHIVVAPVAAGWLCIGLALRSGEGQKGWVANELVHFAILPTDNYHNVFLTNVRRKHTKLAVGGLFSVSIRFVD